MVELKHYHSPLGLYDFQADGVAHAYHGPSKLILWSTGLGKTHCALATAALLFEDDAIDVVLIVCETNKLGEWVRDFERFTDLEPVRYHGSRRKKLLEDLPRVMISTYETIRNDAAQKIEGRVRALEDGPLTEALADKRVLVVYDEISAKFKSRSSAVYRHHDHFLAKIRPNARIIGMTATPVEKDPEHAFNMLRLLDPWMMTVAQFDSEHVLARDIYDRPVGFKNLIRDDFGEGVVPFAQKIEHLLVIKDKADPDVADLFPDAIEDFELLEMERGQQRFYEQLEDLYHEAIDNPSAGLGEIAPWYTVLRQVAGHPHALLRSDGELAKSIVGAFGADHVSKLSSVKLEALVARVESILSQDEQMAVFSFFGQSIVPLIYERLQDEGVPTSIHHGGLSATRREEEVAKFRRGETLVLVSSDAGSRGVNLPEATYITNYELPLLYSTYDQRINRANRIDSDSPFTVAHSYVVADSVEEGILATVQKRQEWTAAVKGLVVHQSKKLGKRMELAQSIIDTAGV